MVRSLAWRRSFGRPLAFAAWALLVIASFIGATAINGFLDLRPGPSEYDLPAWEARNFANKWLYEFGELFRRGRSPEEKETELRRFFRAVSDIARLEPETNTSARADLERAIRERDRLENRVEATIEERITQIARREGLTRDLWILPDLVWPPVDLEFTTSPRTLAVSPRERIELKGTTLLREGLDLEAVTRIEQEREARGDVSALAIPTSGVGAYPTIVTYTSSYRTAVEVGAHEWVHNYLVFRPLGIHYFKNNDLRTMNETVADLVGKEIAEGVLQAWPFAEEAGQGGGNDAPPGVDVRAELVRLRTEVDALLGQGKIEEAESLMEERRQYLAANGYYIRRLNQAYFAFTNLYAGEAGSPGAVSPIGPKIDELRRRSPSLAAFLRAAGGLTSVKELDRALAELDQAKARTLNRDEAPAQLAVPRRY